MRSRQSVLGVALLRPRSTTSNSPGAYLDQAEACLVQAAAAPDAAARALHEEECTLWLMLARQRKAIEDSAFDNVWRGY